MKRLILALALFSHTTADLSKGPAYVPSKNEALLTYINQTSREYGLSLRVIHRLIEVESKWNYARRGQAIGPGMVMSNREAYGLMQVQVPTAKDILNDSTITPERLMNDHLLNVRAGIKYLAWLLELYDGDLELALISYNRGPTKVGKTLASGRFPPRGYAKLIMED